MFGELFTFPPAFALLSEIFAESHRIVWFLLLNLVDGVDLVVIHIDIVSQLHRPLKSQC